MLPKHKITFFVISPLFLPPWVEEFAMHYSVKVSITNEDIVFTNLPQDITKLPSIEDRYNVSPQGSIRTHSFFPRGGSVETSIHKARLLVK